MRALALGGTVAHMQPHVAIRVPQAEPLRVVLIDEHEVTRAACRALLRTEGLEVLADLAVGEDAITATASLRPHVAVVDVTPADDRPLHLAAQLQELDCAPIVLLTSSTSRSAFGVTLDGFAFVPKAALCRSELLKAVQTQRTTEETIMNTSTTPIEQAEKPLWFLNNLAVIHARSDQTNGTYAVVELTGAPGDVPPLHVHTHDDEGFYVLEGALRLHIHDKPVLHLQAGQFAVAPHGIPHVYVVESEQPARWLAISAGGFERFVEEVSDPVGEPVLPTDPKLPPPEEISAIAARHGIVILAPPGTTPKGF